MVRPRSACPSCDQPIAAYDNLPVVSWIVLGRKCRHCKAPISARYATVELLTAILFLTCFLAFGLSLLTLKMCAFCFLMLGLIFTDAETMLLPDAMTLPGFGLGMAFSLFVAVDGFAGVLLGYAGLYVDSAGWMWRLVSLADALIGAGFGAGFIWGIGALWSKLRGVDAMGFGDVKLMLVIGAFLGIKLTTLTLVGASALGSVAGIAMMVAVWLQRTRRRQRRFEESVSASRARAWQSAQVMVRAFPIPFGVFLAGFALIAAFFGNQIIGWYMAFFP